MKSYTGTVVVAGIGNPLIYLYALGVGLATIIDTDLDGVPDFAEANLCTPPQSCPTDPEAVDTDGDGITDYDELSAEQFSNLARFNDFFPGFLIDGTASQKYGTDPTKVDSDDDRLADRFELLVGWIVVRDDGSVEQVFSDPTTADTDGDGLLDRDGKKFELTLLIVAGSAVSRDQAQAFQGTLAPIGVKLEIKALDAAAFYDLVLQRKYQSAFVFWVNEPDPDPSDLFHSKYAAPNGMNVTGYASDEADQLMDEAARELDPGVHDESSLAGAREGHLGELLVEAGLQSVEETTVEGATAFSSFDDWWEPFTLGVGPAGAYAKELDDAARTRLRDRCRELLTKPPFTVSTTAWTARGVV